MAYREQLQQRIEKKEEEITQLQAKLRECEIYLQALQDAMRLLPKDANDYRTVSLRRGSAVAKARDAILKAGRPLHVSEILTAIGKPDEKEGRISLGGSLSSYVRREEVFTRPDPNTFGLVELDRSAAKEQTEEFEEGAK